MWETTPYHELLGRIRAATSEYRASGDLPTFIRNIEAILTEAEVLYEGEEKALDGMYQDFMASRRVKV